MTAVEFAKKNIGVVEQNPKGMQNYAFSDKTFEMGLASVGWKKQQAYCAYSVMYWLKQANDWRFKYMTPSAVQSFNNLAKAFPDKVSMVPVVNALVFWQKGTTPLGHTGIIEAVAASQAFGTIEANTSVHAGSERDGDGVGEKLRKLPGMGDLHVLGFIHP